ncbi:methyltransferase [Streptomyces lunaelactis]|uniref:methyltransferase n=1 Tax=Streptomyces lunaelactis TaxID=1535768 RepID=UPI001584F7FE|nr:methyltransferase [Streptomyces lunaelactis]NUK10051.1 methyltransferase [Streptomyces lunaelactis]NUK52468.1 methyltransferase [Streptomyces lunaelactis]NUK66203.1 methyltransferase [Streptomyces lunaelactis]NUL11921.1 methyltransferase [Streptomyces lunaelactis]NUL24451.1 methyltransferase [Streptomyces lunaelactis]
MDDLAHAEHIVDSADLLRPAAIRAAATLGVADHLAAGVTDVEELARICGTRTDLLGSLLGYLVTLKLLRGNRNDGFALEPAGMPLLTDHPFSVRENLRDDGMTGRSDIALVGLVHTIRTGEPAHVGVFGRGYWESLNDGPAFVEALERLATDQLVCDAELIVEGYDWTGVRDVVDVGGNSGAVLINLLRRHPHLRGTVVDLENTVALAAKNIANAGLQDRGAAVVGSFFDPLPQGRDVYLLSAILADWDDENAVAILRRCAEASAGTGKVLLADVSLDARVAGPAADRTELWLRAMMPTPVRTVEQLTALGHAAGLRVTWEGPATAVRSLIEFSV